MQGVLPFAYQGFNVLSWVPDGLAERGGQWATPLERVEVPSGGFAVVAPASYPTHEWKAIYRCFSRADRLALAAFLDPCLGRYTPFWCPSFRRDLDVLNASSLGTWVVRYAGFAAMFAADPSLRYLYGYKLGGAAVCTVKLLTAVDNGDGTETVTYSTNAILVSGSGGIGVYTPTLTSVEAACILRFARLDQDELTESYSNRGVVDVGVSFASITGETP